MAATLLSEFVAAYPAQPATAFWRAVEIQALARRSIPNGLGLDFGCGDGILTAILMKEVGTRKFVGVDPDPQETSLAKRFDFYRRIHTCSGNSIPEPDGTFDFVIANSVLEHIPDLESTIAEISRVLSPGGKFFFTVPAPAFHDNLRGSILPWVPRARYIASIDVRLQHHNYLAPDEWRVLCARHNLAVHSCIGYLSKLETQRWETLSRMTGGLLYWLSGARLSPIEIQRRLQIRNLQNVSQGAGLIATTIAKIISVRLAIDSENNASWREVEAPSCYLVEGYRQQN